MVLQHGQHRRPSSGQGVRRAALFILTRKSPPAWLGGLFQWASLGGTRRQRLAGQRPGRRRRTGGRTFAARNTGHVHEWRARKATQRDQRSTSRNSNRQWGARAGRYRRSSGKRKSAGNRSTGRDRSTDGERGCHRRTRHVRDCGTRGRARRTGRTSRTGRTGRTGCSGSCFACRPVHACSAARFQRSRYCGRAQRYRGTAQSNASNNFDAESVEGCHRRQLSFTPSRSTRCSRTGPSFFRPTHF